jgi:hypothetical protein
LHEDHGWSHQIQELQSSHLGKPAQWHHGASGILLVDVTRLPSSQHFHAVYTNRNNGSDHKEPHKTSQILPVERDQNPPENLIKRGIIMGGGKKRFFLDTVKLLLEEYFSGDSSELCLLANLYNPKTTNPNYQERQELRNACLLPAAKNMNCFIFALLCCSSDLPGGRFSKTKPVRASEFELDGRDGSRETTTSSRYYLSLSQCARNSTSSSHRRSAAAIVDAAATTTTRPLIPFQQHPNMINLQQIGFGDNKVRWQATASGSSSSSPFLGRSRNTTTTTPVPELKRPERRNVGCVQMSRSVRQVCRCTMLHSGGRMHHLERRIAHLLLSTKLLPPRMQEETTTKPTRSQKGTTDEIHSQASTSSFSITISFSLALSLSLSPRKGALEGSNNISSRVFPSSKPKRTCFQT